MNNNTLAAHAVVERYCADMRCSDDREYYRIMCRQKLPCSHQLTPSP